MMIKLGGITLFTIIFMSVLFNVDPAKVIVTLIQMPIFLIFFIASIIIAGLFSVFEKAEKE